MKYSFAVIGGGAWGTAISIALARKSGHKVIIWMREQEVCEEINQYHKNSLYLPNVNLNKNIVATNNISEAIAPIIFYVTPAQHFRRVINSHKQYLKKSFKLIICSKGIEQKTGSLLSDIIDEINLKNEYAIFSGPSFAKEIAKGKPAALVLAARSLKLAEKISNHISLKGLRIYTSNDVLGVQAGGAIKNVYAIGCGIANGMGYGKSAEAAIITRSIIEMSRFCVAIGGKKETIYGLSGLGDAILTCNSELSRNFILGKNIGKGRTISQILRKNVTIAEGYYTINAINKIIKKHSINMPILESIYSILYKNKDPKSIAKKLMTRPIKEESIS